MIGWLYPIKHNISVSCCLLNVIIMSTIKIGNAPVGKFVKPFLGGNVIILVLDCKAFCYDCIVCNCTKPICQGYSSLYPLSVIEHPWDMVGVDFVTDLTKSSEFYFTRIIFCLPVHKYGTLSFVS